MKQYSIRQQVAAITFIPLFIMAICMEIFFMQERIRDMDNDLLKQGELLVHHLAANSEYGVFSNNHQMLLQAVNGALQQQDVRGAAVLNPASEILSSAGRFSVLVNAELIDKSFVENEIVEMIGGSERQTLAQINKTDDAIIFKPALTGDSKSVWFYHAIIPAQIVLDNGGEKEAIKPLGAVIVEISKSRFEENKSRMLWTTLSVTALFLTIVFYAVYLASRSIINPISDFSSAVQKIGEGRLDTRVSEATSIRELSTLAQGLNETTINLQQERANLEYRIEKATRALREKKDEAERSSESKSHFLAVASHDLRQPLHAAGLYIAELQRRVQSDEQHHLVDRIERCIESLSSLLNALFDISKLDAGAVIPQIQSCNLATIMECLAADFQMLAGQKDIRLVVRPLYGYIATDSQLVERILVNLIGNAIRYTQRGGCVLVACRKRNGYLCIEVRDNGIGISETDQKKVFREFFQIAPESHGQNPVDGVNKGLGLGLSIVDRLVKLLGYHIELRSKPGNGSTFTLKIPVENYAEHQTDVQSKLEDKAEYRVKKASLVGTRLLVVDDDVAVLSSTSSFLRSCGCAVDFASSFSQVEQLLSEGAEWDLVISDYHLEDGKNGLDVISAVRRHHNRPTPCILVSGDTKQSVVEAVKANGYTLLQKPVKPGKLKSLMMHLLDPL